jgi:hypothetical protein
VALTDFNVAPLEESIKIHYFEDGIIDLSFSSIKSTIMDDRQKFGEFDTVMQLYVNFKRSQKSETPSYQVCNVSAIQGHGGVRQGHGGRGGGGQSGRAQGLVPQEEIKKVTHPTSVYSKLILAKKATLNRYNDSGRNKKLLPRGIPTLGKVQY